MKKWAHLVVAGSYVAALFLPVFNWTFHEASEASLSYTLQNLTYSPTAGSIMSQMENKALFWLALGLGILQVALALAKLSPLLMQKLYNASAMLSSALVFSLIVTGYRAEKSIMMEVASRNPGLAAWLLLFAWLGSLYLFFRYRKSA